MKVRQNGQTYTTFIFNSKKTSVSLCEYHNGVTSYTPMVSDGQEIEIEGQTYSYDSASYPKIAAYIDGNTYHAINKQGGEEGLKPVAYLPTVTSTYTLYGNNPNLTTRTNRRAWRSDRLESIMGHTVKTAIIGSAMKSDWESDENYLEKVETTDGNTVPFFKISDYVGFAFADIVVVPTGSTEAEKASKLTWIHMNAHTTSSISFLATIWIAGPKTFAVKVDPANNKAYYGGNVTTAASPQWQEIPYEFNFTKDSNGWYDINIPISIVLDSVTTSNAMYNLVFIPNSALDSYYIDNLYIYELERTYDELKAMLYLEITEAQMEIDNAEIGSNPGQYPQSAVDTLQTALNSAIAVYQDESSTKMDLVNSSLTLASEIETFKTKMISDLVPEITDATTINAISNSTANYASSVHYGAVASASTAVQSADYAIDGKINTRWESAQSDPQSFIVDMGQAREFDKLGIAWETACGEKYSFSYSLDGNAWVDFASDADNSAGNLNIIYTTGKKTARFIRINCSTRHTAYGYSIFEFFVALSTDQAYIDALS